MKNLNRKLTEFLAKIDTFKRIGGVDLSAAEDLSLAVMNLVSLEEHFFFTGAKTGNGAYYDTAREARELRTRLMKELLPEHEGESWCAAKHLLAASMRLVEVGNRYQSEGQKEKARAFFEDAYRLYAIFWALKAKLLSVKQAADSGKEVSEKKWSLEQLVGKLADCCNEK